MPALELNLEFPSNADAYTLVSIIDQEGGTEIDLTLFGFEFFVGDDDLNLSSFIQAEGSGAFSILIPRSQLAYPTWGEDAQALYPWRANLTYGARVFPLFTGNVTFF